MSFSRRLVAALTGALLLQLMLLGSGTVCAMHGLIRADASPRAMSMAAMVHQTGRSSDESNAPTSPVDCNGNGNNDGCPLPFAPGSCSSMTTCDVSAAPAPTLLASAYVPTIEPELPSATFLHSGPTFAPELPPPRA